MLYTRLTKALYGCLKSALLFYQKLSGDLVQHGFKINPYDPCVANRMVNGHQLTVTWHVDDLKVSHRDEKVVSSFVKWLGSVYGNLRTTRGKKHDYLGMDLDYLVKGKVKLGMVKYVQDTIKDFPELIVATAATPAAAHLFEVRDECNNLEEERAVIFHRVVATLLFLCQRARPDIQTAISFLTTRVIQPDEEDWKKLVHVLKYLFGTQYMRLTLSADITS